MTLPGLALFYGGLVRTKNVLSVIAQCFGCAGLATLLWWAFGYSFAFEPGIALPGRPGQGLLQGRQRRAQHQLRLLGVARTSSPCSS